MSAAAGLVAALLVATAVVLLGRPPALGLPPAEAAPGPPEERALLARLRLPLTGLVALGAWAALGGVVGTVAAPVAALVAWRVLGRVEDPAVARRRERLEVELPTGVDLLASCLDAGAAPEAALLTVGRALGGPVEAELLAVHARIELGVDPATVWRDLARHPQLGPLGRTVARAHDSGASVATAVRGLAAELRERAEAEVEARARSIEVKAAAPLGLCLLPAFVLLGIVPLVAGAFASLAVLR
ncbi:type II secretion system F family protein [Nocardioides aurantiacus]|uniref:type II secretion system F family protein n=1 Tax=Nocardioides aurantiacus TaxID=86796 RepID=UPI00403F4637